MAWSFLNKIFQTAYGGSLRATGPKGLSAPASLRAHLSGTNPCGFVPPKCQLQHGTLCAMRLRNLMGDMLTRIKKCVKIKKMKTLTVAEVKSHFSDMLFQLKTEKK
jgi:hypothetical protein